MDLNTYQDRAMSFRLGTATTEYAEKNLVGEVGEFFSLQAKAIRDGEKEDHRTNIKKELGDILWHVAALAKDNGFTLGDIAYSNIEKLESRRARNVIAGSGDNR